MNDYLKEFNFRPQAGEGDFIKDMGEISHNYFIDKYKEYEQIKMEV